MNLTEYKTLISEGIANTLPDLKTQIPESDIDMLIDFCANFPAKAIIQELDDRLAIGGSYVDKVSELKTEFNLLGE